ncbi:hypothetical protein [Scytonema sp. PCC 10023]|uniref:hypothetical protein n=1 Tax=Scytonema sp. PCC 10023 TaxID=1680591 RepID=UPI0039C63AB5
MNVYLVEFRLVSGFEVQHLSRILENLCLYISLNGNEYRCLSEHFLGLALLLRVLVLEHK